jgi:hypothetical protein
LIPEIRKKKLNFEKKIQNSKKKIEKKFNYNKNNKKPPANEKETSFFILLLFPTHFTNTIKERKKKLKLMIIKQ